MPSIRKHPTPLAQLPLLLFDADAQCASKPASRPKPAPKRAEPAKPEPEDTGSPSGPEPHPEPRTVKGKRLRRGNPGFRLEPGPDVTVTTVLPKGIPLVGPDDLVA
jgi:hypothetical protein